MLQLVTDYRLLEVGVVTRLFVMKMDYKEELCQVQELISREVKKAVEAATIKAKKQVDEACCTIGILQVQLDTLVQS